MGRPNGFASVCFSFTNHGALSVYDVVVKAKDHVSQIYRYVCNRTEKEDQPDLGPRDYIGLLAWSIGFTWETVADSQKFAWQTKMGDQRFNSVLNTGLWRYSVSRDSEDKFVPVPEVFNRHTFSAIQITLGRSCCGGAHMC